MPNAASHSHALSRSIARLLEKAHTNQPAISTRAAAAGMMREGFIDSPACYLPGPSMTGPAARTLAMIAESSV
jgi:hypothetical protein